MFKPGDKVKVKRDIYRQSAVNGKGYTEAVLYCEKGKEGEIVEIFYPPNSSALARPYPHAKVWIESYGYIRTFRLSSIEKLKDT